MVARNNVRGVRARSIRSAIWAVAGICAATASAHHSFSAFNRSEAAKASIIGTVKEFALINPHGFLKLAVREPRNKVALWSFELSSATQLHSYGWKPDSIRVGDTVNITYFPLRFGNYGGQLLAVRMASGRSLVGTAEPDRGYPKPAGGGLQ